jgi:DNA-binding XRE family transcriptional regulator
LAEFRRRLDAPISWEQKRRLIEVLVAGVRVDTVEERGVKQTRTTVNYRFSQPGQPMPIVLPQSYNTGRVIRVPTELNTVGDHIRRKRLDLKMLQREVAEQLGVCEPSLFNWEANTVSPGIECMPAIIRFLGYNPLPAAKSWGERLVRHRTSLGMTEERPRNTSASTPARWRGGSAARGSRQGCCWRGWSGSSMMQRRRTWTRGG